MRLSGWGRVHYTDLPTVSPTYGAELAANFSEQSDGQSLRPITIYGKGRSYGDVALNYNGQLIQTHNLDRFIEADWSTGVVKVESGMTIDTLLQVCVPKGWFVPVTPGTKFVTLGGCVANDVHGKNHHQVGSFGAHILSIAIMRSDGEIIELSDAQYTDLFQLTISGLGLTGIILWVQVQLVPIKNSNVHTQNIPFTDLDEFFELSENSKDWPYTVAWVDCFAKPPHKGRGIFSRARYSDQSGSLTVHPSKALLSWPFETPSFLLNKFSIKMMNLAYMHRPSAKKSGLQHYDPFFYPLDRVHRWNLGYGRNGFYQHQSIIPKDTAKSGVAALLNEVEKSGQGSFLCVLKSHGAETSPGRLSFCMEGVSLALDFPNKGIKTRQMLSRLDHIAIKHGGRMYPAKDGLMSAQSFKTGYPGWEELEAARDPALNSSFWQRVTENKYE